MPWAAAVYDYNSANASKYDPEGYCLPPGGPRMMATPYPMEIVQLPDQQAHLHGLRRRHAHLARDLHGRTRASEGRRAQPTYLGHSVGRWEGDTLVVDVVGFNEGTWIDYYGHPHTDLLHVVERFHDRTRRSLRYEATIDDPGAYTRPWTVSWNSVEPDRRVDGVHLPGEQPVPVESDRRSRSADLWPDEVEADLQVRLIGTSRSGEEPANLDLAVAIGSGSSLAARRQARFDRRAIAAG